MFKLQPNPTFRANVPISIPGQAKSAMIDFEFKHKSRQQYFDYSQTLKDRSDIDALSEIVVGWNAVDQAYSPEALGELLDNYPSSAVAILETYRRELFEARAKN